MDWVRQLGGRKAERAKCGRVSIYSVARPEVLNGTHSEAKMLNLIKSINSAMLGPGPAAPLRAVGWTRATVHVMVVT